MTRAKEKAQGRAVRGWREARTLLERWRRDLKTLTVELKQPRVIDVIPIDFVSGGRLSARGSPRQNSEDNSFTLRTQT